MNVPQVTWCVPMVLSVSTSLAEWPVPACLDLCRMEYNAEVGFPPKRLISGETYHFTTPGSEQQVLPVGSIQEGILQARARY